MFFREYLEDRLKNDAELRSEYEKISKPVDFFIHQKPTHISFDCPFCGLEVEIRWDYIYVPEYWSDDWGHVECPYCEELVKLGDYDI